MDVSGFTWVFAVAVLACIVVLLAICLDCSNSGPLASISQTNASDEYMPSTEFRLIHPSPPFPDVNSTHALSNLLLPYSPSVDVPPQRRTHSFTPTETESNPSYENPAEGSDYQNDSDAEDTGYIIVLGDSPPAGDPSTNQSRASSPSSDAGHDYVNFAKVVVSSEDRDYQNVDPERPSAASPQSDSDDEYEGNYVNQPEMIHRQPSI
ncbi:linker for activation of T-cells family member 1-like isoform X2 [Thalassophryne amazonica]|uniref:linker for activation of T-cells family member 1-like isoform X2 n=1 Tax=Thalassophryne amazonica TaxID=390379 RepID=UPI0014710F25|nr:linker for activation of T-cells family member 1-like isoform X2 [Thalassophryne amazonica]